MAAPEFLEQQVPFLAGLSRAQAEELLAQAGSGDYPAGATVLFRGTTVDGLHVIESGRVSVLVKPAKGKTPVVIAELGPGEVFGETSILESTMAGATVKAGDEGARVLVIPQEAFREVLSAHPELAARARALIDSRRQRNAQAVAAPAVPAAA